MLLENQLKKLLPQSLRYTKYIKIMVKIILASKSKVRKQILDNNNISTEVQNSNVDEDIVYKKLEALVAGAELASKQI